MVIQVLIVIFPLLIRHVQSNLLQKLCYVEITLFFNSKTRLRDLILVFKDIAWDSLSLLIMRFVLIFPKFPKFFPKLLIMDSNGVLYSFIKDFKVFFCSCKCDTISFCSHFQLSLSVLNCPLTYAYFGITSRYNAFVTKTILAVLFMLY